MKIAVLISGRGSNLQALIEARAGGRLPAEIGLVISDRPGVPGLRRALEAGIDATVIDHRRFPDRAGFEAALDSVLRAAACDLVCLAGFMRVLGAGFVNRWSDRIVNIHPSLLPAFPGLDCHRRALAAGVRIAGCTVHFCRPELDSGPILAQAAVPVLPDDTAARLAARVLDAEHELYPLAVRLVAEGRVRVLNEVVRIDGMASAPGRLLNPVPD